MSQAIRKFAEGGSVEKPKEPKLMNWEGVGDYDLNSIVATSIKNREGYLQHQNWGNKRAEGFNTALDFLVEGLGSGKIKRKSDGSFEIIGGGAESTGKYDRNFLGGIKNNTNTAYTDAASYLSNVMGSLSTYKAPVEEKKVDNTLKDYKFDLMGAVRDKTFGGGDWSDEGWEMQDTFDETTKSRGTANRQRILSEILRGQVKSIRENADFDKQYKGTSAFSTGADRATALEALANKLDDGNLNDDDYKSAFAAGLGDIRGYFNTLQAKNEQVPEEGSEAAVQGEIKSILESNRNSGDSYYSSLGLSKPNMDLGDPQTLKGYSANNPINWASYSNQLEGDTLQDFSNRFHGYFSNIKAKDLENQQFKENGWYYLPESLDEASGSIMRFNGTTLEKVPLSSFSKGKKYLSDKVLQSRGLVKKWEYDTGGIIKAQQGWYVDNTAKVEKTLTQPKKEEAPTTDPTSTKSTNKAKPREFSRADYVRLGSLAGDVTSLVASMSGVGAPVSAAIGAASTAANQTADMMEGQGFWKSLGNNAVGYGMDALSLIPFAKAAKVPRMVKTVSRFAPQVISALGVMEGIHNSDQYIKTFEKAARGESLNVDDWRNIVSGLQLVASTGSNVHRASKAKEHTNAAVSGTHEWLKTDQGWRKVESSKVASLRGASKLEDQNKILEGTGITLRESTSLFGNPKGKADINKPNYVYDFDKPVTTYSGDLPLQHKFNGGEKALGNLQLPNIPGLRKYYNAVVHPQAYRRAKGNNVIETPSVTKSTERVVKPPVVNNHQLPPASNIKSPIVTPPPGQYKTVPAITDVTNHNTLYTSRQPSKPDAKAIVGSQTIAPNTPIGDLINKNLIPKKPVTGTIRKQKEAKYEDVFAKEVQAQNDNDWNRMSLERDIDKGLSGLDRSPRLVAPVGTEITYTAPSTSKVPTAKFVTIQDDISKMKRSIQTSLSRKSASQNNTLPHKKKKEQSKKKNTDKGYVNKRAEGGVIKAEEGTRVNVQSLNPNYNRGNFLGSEDVLSYFKGIKNSNDAANFNQREDIYDNEYTQAYGPGSLKSWNTNTHLATTKKDWGTGVLQNLWGKTGLNKNLWGSMGNGYGKTGDNPGGPYPDQLFGDITYQRTLGRGVDTKYADQINSILKESGMQYAPDAVHGGYRVTPLKPGGISIPTKAMTPASVRSMPAPKVSKFVKPDREETKPRNTLGLNTEDTIALGRMLGGLATNNRATAQYKEGLRPTLVDTYENYVPTTGDLYTKRAQYNQAAELDRVAATPMTSDSQHQLAGMFESRMKGNQLRTQGDLADSQMIRQTADLGRQEANAAKGRRTEVANQNRAQSNMINAAKSQIDSAKTTANYQQVLAPYLAGIENTYRQNTAMGKQYQAESDQQQLRLKYSGAYDTAQKDYYNATTDQQRESAIALKKKTDESYTKEAIDMRKNLGVTPWMFTKKSVPEYTITPTYAKGGKVSETGKALLQSARDFNKRLLVDNTIFHKDIMESKREHNKLIASMSSLTASLIKNGMSWK